MPTDFSWIQRQNDISQSAEIYDLEPLLDPNNRVYHAATSEKKVRVFRRQQDFVENHGSISFGLILLDIALGS